MFSWATSAAPSHEDELREAVEAAVAETKQAMAQAHRLALRKVATDAISRTRAELERSWEERERSYEQGIVTLGAELGAVEEDANALSGTLAEQAALLSAERSASEELASSLISAQHAASAALEQAAADATVSRDHAVKLALAQAAEMAAQDRARATEATSQQFAQASAAALAEARRLSNGKMSEDVESAVRAAVAQTESAMAEGAADALAAAVQAARAEAAAQAASDREALLAELAETQERQRRECEETAAAERTEAEERFQRFREEATEQARVEAVRSLEAEREQMRVQAKAEAMDAMQKVQMQRMNLADSAMQERAVALVREQTKQHVQAELRTLEQACLAREGVLVATLCAALQHADSHADQLRAEIASLRASRAELAAQLESARHQSMGLEARRLLECKLVLEAATADSAEALREHGSEQDDLRGLLKAQSDARVASACADVRKEYDAKLHALQSNLQAKNDEMIVLRRAREAEITHAAQEAARQTEARLRVAGLSQWQAANTNGKVGGTPGSRPPRPDLK